MEEKSFTIIDSPEMCTMAFRINKPEEGTSYCTLQKLDYSFPEPENVLKKTFYLDASNEEDESIVLLTINKEKAFLNAAVLKDEQLSITKEPTDVSFKVLYSADSSEYKDLRYTPNFKRPISIIDPEMADEVRPTLYYDEDANMVKAKIKLQPNKSYIALEIKQM